MSTDRQSEIVGSEDEDGKTEKGLISHRKKVFNLVVAKMSYVPDVLNLTSVLQNLHLRNVTNG